MSVGIEPMGEMVLLEMENAPEKTEWDSSCLRRHEKR